MDLLSLSFHILGGVTFQSGVSLVIKEALDLLVIWSVTTEAFPLSAGKMTADRSVLRPLDGPCLIFV